jgi:hypothetical protein
VRKKGSPRAFSTHTENIGAGGICVILEKDLGLFSPVELEIDLKDDLPEVECDGTIVWVVRRAEYEKRKPNHYDTGIEFIDLKDTDKTRINAIVDRILKEEAKET